VRGQGKGRGAESSNKERESSARVPRCGRTAATPRAADTGASVCGFVRRGRGSVAKFIRRVTCLLGASAPALAGFACWPTLYVCFWVWVRV